MDASTEPAADPREEEGALKSGPSLLPPPPHLDVLRAVQQPLVQQPRALALTLADLEVNVRLHREGAQQRTGESWLMAHDCTGRAHRVLMAHDSRLHRKGTQSTDEVMK